MRTTTNKPRLPKLIRFLALHAAFGSALGCLLALALLVTDTIGIGSLFMNSDAKLVAGILYFGSFAVTFGSVAMGSAIMHLSDDK